MLFFYGEKKFGLNFLVLCDFENVVICVKWMVGWIVFEDCI